MRFSDYDSVGWRYKDVIRQYGAVLVLAGLFLCLLAMPSVCLGDADTIYRENSPAVVVILAIDQEGKSVSQGSGFVVRGDGTVVTNYHVISGATDIKAKVGERVVNVQGVFYVDPENDIALIKLDGTGYPQVKLGDPAKLQVGEKVFVIGSPQGLENTISEGILSGIRGIGQNRKVLQMTAAISPGSSGGPVFNNRGEVVGVATLIIAETQNLNFAMPVNVITAGLDKKGLVSPRDACQVDFKETAGCWFYQGLAYGSMGQHNRAAEAFNRSLKIDSGKDETYVNLGVSYAYMERYEEAEAMFRKALEINPSNPETLGKLGVIYSAQGKHKDALELLKKAVALKGDDPMTRYNLAVTYEKLGQMKNALEAVNEAIKLAPDAPEPQGLLGSIYIKTKKYGDAAVAFKKAIHANPGNPKMHLGLGRAYVLMGDRASALQEYKIVKEIDKETAETLFKLIYK